MNTHNCKMDTYWLVFGIIGAGPEQYATLSADCKNQLEFTFPPGGSLLIVYISLLHSPSAWVFDFRFCILDFLDFGPFIFLFFL